MKPFIYILFLKIITFLWSFFPLNSTRDFLLFLAQKIARNNFFHIFSSKFGPKISLSFPSDISWLKYSLERNYEKSSINFLYKFSKDVNGVFIDVGSNIGWFSVHMLYFNNKNIVHSFEPQNLICKKLIKNIEINGFENRSIINNHGLSSADNKNVNIYNMPNNPHGHAFLENKDGAEIIDSIELKTLDNYVESNVVNNIKFIKIDVEGHELDVLLGAKWIIKFHEPIIMFEAKSSSGKISTSFQEIYKFIKSVDERYVLYKIPDYKGHITKVTSVGTNDKLDDVLINYTNLLFVPNKYLNSMHRWIN